MSKAPTSAPAAAVPIEINEELYEQLTADQIVSYYKAFQLFDRDGDHTITAKEIEEVFTSLNQQVSSDQLADILTQFDSDGNGKIDFNEFLKMMVAKSKDTAADGSLRLEEYKDAFKMFDMNNDGKINAEELRDGMNLLGESDFTLNDAVEMLNEADQNGDGLLDFEEFVQCLTNKQ